MVVGIDIRSLSGDVGGIPEYTYHIVRALLARETRHSYVLLSNAARATTPIPFPLRGPHHQVCALRYPNKFLHASIAATGHPMIENLIKWHCGIRPDVLFFPSIHFLSFSSRVPAVLTVHDLSFLHYADLLSWKGRVWHRLIRPRTVIGRAAHICAVSEWTRHDLERSYGVEPSRITVTPIDCAPEFTTTDAEGNGEPRTFILLFGADNLRKNAAGVLEAWRHACGTAELGARYSLVLVGRDTEWLRRIARSDSRNAPVIVRTLVSNHERMMLYRRAAVLLYPSITEGFGIPLLEAARMHVPIIAANHSSIGEVIGRGALYVDPFSVGDLSRALRTVLGNAEVRSSLIHDAACAAQAYSWEETAACTQKVIEYTYDHWH